MSGHTIRAGNAVKIGLFKNKITAGSGMHCGAFPYMLHENLIERINSSGQRSVRK